MHALKVWVSSLKTEHIIQDDKLAYLANIVHHKVWDRVKLEDDVEELALRFIAKAQLLFDTVDFENVPEIKVTIDEPE